MPGGRNGDDSEGGAPKLSLSQRMLLALPRLRRQGEKEPLGDRLRDAVLKPVEPGPAGKKSRSDGSQSIEDLEEAVAFADDRERLTGLILAPIAGALAILVANDLISHDPAQHLKSGALNRLYTPPSTYHELELVLVVLAAVMLVTAMLRKRLFFGIAAALYGLAIFNLHYWGFGIPYVLVGAVFLVRSYRLQRDLKEATGEGPGAAARRRPGNGPGRPSPNKRYTRPTPPRNSPTKKRPRSEDEKRAG